jgi:hypothetical protein
MICSSCVRKPALVLRTLTSRKFSVACMALCIAASRPMGGCSGLMCQLLSTMRLHAHDGAAATAIGIQRLGEKGSEGHLRRADAMAALGAISVFVSSQSLRQRAI